MGEVVFEGTGQAIRQTDFVADQAPAVFNELRQGAHRRALGGEGRELVTVFEQELDLEFGIGGVIFGPARGKRFAVLGHGERMDGKEHEEIIVAQRGHDGPFIEFQAHRDRLAVEARAQGLDPRIDRLRAVFEPQKLPALVPAACKQISCLASAQSRPTKAANASGACGFMCDLPACGTVVRRDMPAGVLRRHYREPVTRQTLSIR